jgi:hypothetical protein
MAYKRKTKKTGPNTRRTTTQSSKGTRITNTTKSSLGGNNKRTYSWSWDRKGRLKQTTTDNRDGWITRKSRTVGAGRKSGGARRRRSSKGDDFLMMVILWIILLPFKIVWWLLKRLLGK